jgi:hypothetical protein
MREIEKERQQYYYHSLFAYIYARLVILFLKIKLMSSTNDIYHHLFVQTQPKSILKKSPSPKFLETSTNSKTDQYSNTNISSTNETKQNDIDKNKTNNNHVCILNDNQSIKKDNSDLSSIEVPLTKLIPTCKENVCQHEIDSELIQTNPPTDSSPSPLTSDDEHHHHQQSHSKTKSKKIYYRPVVVTRTLSSSASSSDNNDERKAKRSIVESETTLIRSNTKRYATR